MTGNEELKTVAFMISLFCRKKHKAGRPQLCRGCAELLEYVKLRREKCPWGEGKPFCSSCPVHCYRPDMRAKIIEVMRFSGPRMVFYRPWTAVRHIAATVRQKMRQKKNEKKGESCLTKN